ncbi:MAG: spore coat associated protein CotJA [Clostridium butyricum]|nr:spore coat associated protein CotJA [Clostridium butyricum]
MYRHEKSGCKLNEYARAFILPQKYENLFTCKEGFYKGTIFKDLYSPYNEKKKNEKC